MQFCSYDHFFIGFDKSFPEGEIVLEPDVCHPFLPSVAFSIYYLILDCLVLRFILVLAY